MFRGQQAPKALKVQPERKALKDLLAPKALKVQPERKAAKAQPVPRALRAQLAHKVRKATKVLKVIKARLVQTTPVGSPPVVLPVTKQPTLQPRHLPL